MVSGLSWQGHELLDNIRDSKVWAKTKERVKALASVSLKMIAAIAEEEIKKFLGLR